MKKTINQTSIEYLDSLIELYHQNHPEAETPLNFIEILGVEKMIEILEEADDRVFEIDFDYSKPQQPTLKSVVYKEIA
jgi:hypothetical protein